MAKPAFNGTNKEIRQLFREHLDNGGTSADFNKQFSSITVNGRTVKGLRTDGKDAKGQLKIKINYKDTVDAYEGKRDDALSAQTHGERNFPSTLGKKDHHIRPPSVYQTFFDGLSPEDQAELARYSAEDLQAPLGDVDANDAKLSTWEHDNAYHAWDRGHDGVKPGQSEPTNFKVPEGATLDERKSMLKMFIQEGPQVAMDEALFSARMVSQHPDSEYWAKEFSKHYNVGYGKGQIKPPPGMSREMQSKIGIQNIPGGGRRAMRNLAMAGGAAPGFLGTAASAQETGMRVEQAQQTNNPTDWLQALMSGGSLAADTVSAEPVSAALDAGNVAIDTYRDPEMRAEAQQAATEGVNREAEQSMGVSQGNAPTQTFKPEDVDQMGKNLQELPGKVVQGTKDMVQGAAKGLGYDTLTEQATNWLHTQGLKMMSKFSEVGLTGNTNQF